MTLEDEKILESHLKNIQKRVQQDKGDGISMNQKCSDLILKAKWSKSPIKLFMEARMDSTDYGNCCVMAPDWPIYEFDSEILKDGHKKSKNNNGIQGNHNMYIHLHLLTKVF